MGGKIDPITKACVDKYYADMKVLEEDLQRNLGARQFVMDGVPEFKDILRRYIRKKHSEHKEWEKKKGYK